MTKRIRIATNVTESVVKKLRKNSRGKECKRCAWVNENPLYVKYHDEEWGKPCHNETVLFEMLILEGAQAGLSWETVLNKRENYRVAYDNWDIKKIASYDAAKVTKLLADSGIIRNRLKIAASITNAIAYADLCVHHGSLDNYLWSHLPNKEPILSTGTTRIITSDLSDRISKDLKAKGFKFVGSTIIYAYLQAIGMVNDHDVSCDFRISK